ncbi:ATP-binding cassette domain-containing protein [Helcobacillus sp. ACRRO]|uniref:iron ABC transporter ATP-binding protein n=1 Tax=Helcobacillus TaxID=1161125 RepID=UPI001EF60602|nr:MULTISPECIES: ATP-binding cassette domain-containing protein [Helcobacillus]MCG7427183.1 ATP-binding cassette domain-containing protein [Helcobacillus sp. ACRRO]MDK7741902.1 ATP-binding cassette domain-containing protein [Helcobacillus massiliensis]WOO92907.1 ATP-binding cassette domain-containing protein [Helcobacillus massiliensis]
MIICDGVTKRYGTTTVVDDVRLLIQTGGLTSIIGPNGAGKSTLLSMMARLLTMDGGRVSVDGLDVAATDSAVLARRLAILRQDNHLDIRLTVRDLVAFGRYPHSKGRPTIEDRVHVDRALDYMDMGHLAGRFLDELSGGQRQRAFVAMTLAQDTEYILLDEPLNNLDMPHGVAMMSVLQRAAKELGKTVVVVIHDINFASAYSDRIIAMREGRVIEQGTPAEIVTPPVMQEVYGLTVDVVEHGGHPFALYFHASAVRPTDEAEAAPSGQETGRVR